VEIGEMSFFRRQLLRSIAATISLLTPAIAADAVDNDPPAYLREANTIRENSSTSTGWKRVTWRFNNSVKAFTVAASDGTAGSCATRSGPAPNGTKTVVACINAADLRCPARGSVYECRNGYWYCLFGGGTDASQPCASAEAGAWEWKGNDLQRVQ
jgi:hypothetical protein